MKADASSAMFIVLDAHNRTMAKNYVQGTLLDRFVECILSARKSGLAVRQGMKQAMKPPVSRHFKVGQVTKECCILQ
jgi:hypothetical protein